MKKIFTSILFLVAFTFFAHAQSESKNLDEKGHRIKTTWTNNGFFHAGIRPGNWELDRFGAVPGASLDSSSNGIHGSPTPIYLSVEQICRYFYWNMDLATMVHKKNYEFTQTQTTGYFKNGTEDIGTYQAVQASFLGSIGYLYKGRVGIYAGGRIGYDNTLVHYNMYVSGGSYLQELGGTKTGYNFHFFFPFIRGMMRISYYNDVMKKNEFNFKAKTHEIEFNYYLPFNKQKSFGMMLKLNHMGYSTTNYLAAFSGLTGGTAINYKRTFFQIGFIIPVYKELSPDACENCRGRGYTIDKGAPCANCNGTGSVTCQHCGGQGLIVTDVTQTCTYCHGSGKVNCPVCGGLGTKEFLKKKECEVCHGTGKKVK